MMTGRRMMRGTALGIALIVGGSAAMATAAEPASRPATQTSTSTSAPAVDPAVDRILDRLEKKGDTIDSIEAAIEFTKTDPVLEDKQEYAGTLRFKKARPNPKFFIQFDVFKHEGRKSEQKQWHVFDGQWYIEAREKTQTISKRQIVRPGESLEVFKLGQGPFPLPFGQKKSEILKQFDVKLVPPQPNDPPHADHLQCTPRPSTETAKKYDIVHFYIDRLLDLPLRVETTEKEEGNQIIASFSKIQVNPGLVESQLNLPALPDYKIDTIPLPAPGDEK